MRACVDRVIDSIGLLPWLVSVVGPFHAFGVRGGPLGSLLRLWRPLLTLRLAPVGVHCGPFSAFGVSGWTLRLPPAPLASAVDP